MLLDQVDAESKNKFTGYRTDRRDWCMCNFLEDFYSVFIFRIYETSFDYSHGDLKFEKNFFLLVWNPKYAMLKIDSDE